MIALEIKNVGRSFNQIRALNEVSFSVEKGEIFGVAGPNGAGKTTLFNVIAGSIRGSGEIIFEGRNICGLKPHQICRLGIARTFQVPTLFNSMNVWENVKMGAHYGRRESRNKERHIRDVINFVGLQGKEQRGTSKLDLLEKKQTMLAAALATKPKLLLLDEPMGGLHPSEIRQFKDIILKMNQELGITVIIIEHLIKKLVELSHQLMILNFGQKLCLGSPQKVVCDPRVVEAYLGADNGA